MALKFTPKTDRLFISFSGGETSGYMTLWCLHNLAPLYKEVVVMFANTGQENEQTLDFVDKCDREFGLNVVWVEAVVDPRKMHGTRHRVVTFETADREGTVFESVIQKYGIPNKAYPHCTRELKLAPMKSYLRSLGWVAGSYETAVGIRVDEIDRMAHNAAENKIIYPLVSLCPTTKPGINAWWSAQKFRLPLKGYEGNCKWCWKKSLRKHLTLATEHPDVVRLSGTYGSPVRNGGA